ncbi:phasin family protein [Ectothiorhodospira magna]|uniref:Phasin family protein n=1 Tax=Ectothiorhodospira magna TaxID=867345 RepID=A0A1H9A4Q4_9GAMM|nr:phasin family protein [Ectothiorhodospira magna]SEP71680.1 phasin family protein [Ectothiorhodospira magna]
MYNEFFNGSQEQFEKFVAPARKFNNATLDHVAKLVEYQISLFRSYSEISIEQMRAMQTVTDPKSFQAYMTAQAEATKSLSEKVAKDANELVELQRGYAEEVQKLSEEGLATVTSIDPAKTRKTA